MKTIIGGIILIVGILILLVGVATPMTTQQTSNTCYNDPLGYGQNCVETTYDSPNTGKTSIILFGVITTTAGGALMFLDIFPDWIIYSSPEENERISLAEQIKQDQKKEEKDEDKPDYLKIGK